jgi:hypothetical protein
MDTVAGDADKLVVGPAGAIVLPPLLLAELGIQPGDLLTVTPMRGGVLLVPAPRDIVESTYGLARAMWRGVGGSAEFVREMGESWRA